MDASTALKDGCMVQHLKMLHSKMDVGVTLEDRLEYDSPLKEKAGQDCWFGVGTRQ